MSTRKTRKQIAREKEKLAVITDGCNPELVEDADFDGLFEIPIIKRPEKIMIPKGMVPFSKMNRVEPEKFAVCEYELDREPDSPAVDIKIVSPSFVKPQKIHFIYESE